MKKEWTHEEAEHLFYLPLMELLFQAQTVHRAYFSAQTVQVSTLFSVKTGRCPENCSYCSQSIHYATPIQVEKLQPLPVVLQAAEKAKEAGATRFCLGAAWRSPTNKDLSSICQMITGIKKLGLETCVSLGMLQEGQAEALKAAGLDFYNHNLDTSEEYYAHIVSTRTFQQRLTTLKRVAQAGIKICCGAILGLGETNTDRISLLITLANLDHPPESVPINQLIPIPGTPLADQKAVDPFDFVRTIALARILMPQAYIRLSAGRENMSDELHALCFLAGANSFFHGEKLLTASNASPDRDKDLLQRLGLRKERLETNCSC